MTIFIVIRLPENEFVGGYTDTSKIFELPEGTYKVCATEEGMITKCVEVVLTADKTVHVAPEEPGVTVPPELVKNCRLLDEKMKDEVIIVHEAFTDTITDQVEIKQE